MMTVSLGFILLYCCIVVLLYLGGVVSLSSCPLEKVLLPQLPLLYRCGFVDSVGSWILTVSVMFLFIFYPFGYLVVIFWNTHTHIRTPLLSLSLDAPLLHVPLSIHSLPPNTRHINNSHAHGGTL